MSAPRSAQGAKRKTILEDGRDDVYDYEDYFEREEKEQKRLEEQRKRRRERLADLANEPRPENSNPVVEPVPNAEVKKEASSPTHVTENTLPNVHEPDTKQSDEYVEIEVDDDDIDDMFALEDTPQRKKKKIRVRKDEVDQTDKLFGQARVSTKAVGLHDNWDDPEGYYRVILGEKLDQSRYQVFSNLGRGIFASVVRAKDLQQHGREVAIKIARRQETMYKAGMKEMSTLRLLVDADPEDKMHIVRLYSSFEHRGHLCMVFESLGLNLREIVRRFGKEVGLNLQAVKTYAKQMFMALILLRKENIIHADIKPDNILVNEAKTVAKLADLGSASSTTEMEITPYLVSRFYRAPEISTYTHTLTRQFLGSPMDVK